MPGPSDHPPIPPTSRAAMPAFRDGAHRRVGAGAFGEGLSDGDAARYDDVRPGYPPEVVALVGAGVAAGTTGAALDVLDVGAGTGKLTAALVADGHRVTAVEPGAEMLAALGRACP
ncbi:methyltransferase domain-containing protein, partial [Corynebacterium freneyi]